MSGASIPSKSTRTPPKRVGIALFTTVNDSPTTGAILLPLIVMSSPGETPREMPEALFVTVRLLGGFGTVTRSVTGTVIAVVLLPGVMVIVPLYVFAPAGRVAVLMLT